MSGFSDFVSDNPAVIFPGATGTELQRRGYPTKLPLWSAAANEEAFDLVKEIHADYFRAGADLCITNTFRTTPRTYKKIGREADARTALQRAVQAARLAQKAADGRRTFVGGSYAPLEDCYEPDRVPGQDELVGEHSQLVEWLVAEGVDFLIPETINAVREGAVMARAASESGLPFVISFVVDEKGCLLDGTPVAQAVGQTDFPGRIAVGLNCRPMDVIAAALPVLTACYAGPVLLYPNGVGRPHDDLGWVFEENDASIEKFVATAKGWRGEGAKILGGCCGTTPKYIQALSRALRSDKSAN